MTTKGFNFLHLFLKYNIRMSSAFHRHKPESHFWIMFDKQRRREEEEERNQQCRIVGAFMLGMLAAYVIAQIISK